MRRFTPARLSAVLALLTACASTDAALFTRYHPTAPSFDRLEFSGVSGDGRYVIGELSNMTTFRATRWNTQDGSITDIGLISGYPYSNASAVSYDGSTVVCDGITSGTYRPRPFVWTDNGS